MIGLLSAIGFLTVLPVGRRASDGLSGANWYPVVGVLVGGLAAGGWFAAYEVWGRGAISAAITLAFWVALTGGLHLDGLADSADAALASVPLEQRRQILRDVHHGTFAILAISFVLLLMFSALASLSQTRGAAAIAVAAVSGRAILPVALRLFPAMPGSRMAAAVRSEVRPWGIGLSVAVTAAGAAAVLGLEGLAIVGTAAATALACFAWLSRRLGGIGGDALGAGVVVVETVVLLSATAFFAHNRGEPFAGWPG